MHPIVQQADGGAGGDGDANGDGIPDNYDPQNAPNTSTLFYAMF